MILAFHLVMEMLVLINGDVRFTQLISNTGMGFPSLTYKSKFKVLFSVSGQIITSEVTNSQHLTILTLVTYSGTRSLIKWVADCHKTDVAYLFMFIFCSSD